MKRLIAISALALTALASSPAYAVTTAKVDFVCPIDGTTFRSEIFTSFTFHYSRLDTRPVYMGSPQSLPLPECPKNGFVLYKEKFNKNEIRKAKKAIATSEFKAIRADLNSYGRAAFIAERIGEEPLTISRLYLRASWEAEDSGKSAQEQEAYLKKSLSLLETFLAKSPPDTDTQQKKILVAELSRRVGNFDAAFARLANLELEAKDSNTMFLRKVSDEIARLARAGIKSPARIPDDK